MTRLMELNIFKATIENRVNELLAFPEQLFFTWLCAVRALPYINVKRHFSCWEKTEIQKQLRSVFYALDIAAFIPFTDRLFFHDGGFQSPESAIIAASKSSDTGATAAITAAAYAAKSVSVDNSYASSYAALSASAAMNSVARANLGVHKQVVVLDFQNLILSDIDIIHSRKYNFLQNNTSFYEEIWDNFQDDLLAIGCEYWGILYKEIFANHFQIYGKSLEALKRRLNVPGEIRECGAAAVADYLINAEKQGAVFVQRETRLIVLGSAGAGKTTLVARLKGDDRNLLPDESTHGVDTSVTLDFNGIKTRVWDFGGQVIYHASHRCFISKNCVYVLVVNARIEENRDINRINYWLDTMRIYSDNKAKVFIILNEADDRKQNPDDYNELKKGEYGSLIQDVYSFNINKDISSLDNFKKELATYIEVVGHQTFGLNDSHALNSIQKLFNEGEQILGEDKLDEILRANDIKTKKDQQRMRELFDTLGVALGYGFMKGYILDPYWISHGVYKVIDYLQKKQSVFVNYSELDVVFADERSIYPTDKREYIIKLMEHYKIGFRDVGGLRGLAIPCAASQSKPKTVTVNIEPENLVTWIERDELLEFPADFFYRYICGNQSDIRKIGERWAMWQEGAVLEGMHANALVELTENRRIKITVWGEEKEAYSEQLFRVIYELFDEYRLTPREEVRKRGGKVIKFIELVVEAAAKGAAKAYIETISGVSIKQ